jgi:hypothetical protein
MKKFLLTIITISFLFTGFSQESIFLNGYVNQLNTMHPIPNHPVQVFADSNAVLANLLTDQSGYFSDTIDLMGIQYQVLTLMTFDCNSQPILQTFPLPAPQGIYAEFDICWDSVPSGCIASFNIIPDPLNPFAFNFINQSTGNYETLEWDFGDGTISSEENPSHTFNGAGLYLICLSVFNYDSLDPCFNQFCVEFQIPDTNTCKADFSFTPDSLDNVPYKFIFKDQSSGDIDSWIWDFGDGNVSFEQNPVHTYASQGSYEVCLTVASSFDPIGCLDVYCQTVTTPEYLFFGGQLFAGDFPINNPTSTGDTGVVYLYRNHMGTTIPVDTQYFHDFGLYAFNNLLDGQYLVKADLTEGSVRHGQYFQTYFPDRALWQQSQLLDLSDTIYDFNIHLIKKPVMQFGTGSISGHVAIIGRESASLQDMPPGVTVMLMSENYQPLKSVKAGAGGNFSFSNLPFGTYRLTADATGWFADIQLTTLHESNVSETDVDLHISESSTLDVEEAFPDLFPEPEVFPNPVKDVLNIRYHAPETREVSVTVTDISGKTVMREQLVTTKGTHLYRIPSATLAAGVYLLVISNDESPYPKVKKFVK